MRFSENRFKELYEANMSDSIEHFLFQFHEQFADIDVTNKNILEIGCGKGFLSLYLAFFTAARHITALDQAAGMGSEKSVLDILKTIVRQYQPDKLLVVEKDFFDFTHSYPYDIVIANNCLHHFCDNGKYYFDDSEVTDCYLKLMRKIYSIINDNGWLCIYEYDPWTLCSILFSKRLYPETEWELHPPFNAWIDMLKRADFKQITRKTHTPFRIRCFAGIIRKDIFRKVFKGNVMIFAKKQFPGES